MKLHELPADPGRKQKKKRRGRGEGSGLGRTSGHGNKGSQARSGRGKGYAGVFEGGQMPLVRRLPKRGFTNIFKIVSQVVNLSSLEKCYKNGDTVDRATLKKHGLVRTPQPIKILGHGDFSRKLNFNVDAVSASAREKIEKAGGTIITTPVKVAWQRKR